MPQKISDTFRDVEKDNKFFTFKNKLKFCNNSYVAPCDQFAECKA